MKYGGKFQTKKGKKGESERGKDIQRAISETASGVIENRTRGTENKGYSANRMPREKEKREVSKTEL